MDEQQNTGCHTRVILEMAKERERKDLKKKKKKKKPHKGDDTKKNEGRGRDKEHWVIRDGDERERVSERERDPSAIFQLALNFYMPYNMESIIKT